MHIIAVLCNEYHNIAADQPHRKACSCICKRLAHTASVVSIVSVMA
jgi:hypothetical protein